MFPVQDKNSKTDYNPELLKLLFENMTESIIVTNKSGAIVLVNPATINLFGYTPDELIGKRVEYLMPQRFESAHQKHRAEYIKKPHSRSMGIGMDLYAKKKDGSEFPVEISLNPFYSNEEKYVIVFLIDITKRKKSEAEVKEQKAQLEKLTQELKANNERLELKVQDRTKVLSEALDAIEKSRMELAQSLEKEKELNDLKSRFLSMASHEFRTPLTTILSSVSLIGEYNSADQQDKRLRHVEKIKSAVTNLNNILGEFLSLSKIEEGKVMADFRKFSLTSLVTDVQNHLKDLCKQGQKITVNHFGPSEVYLDPNLMRNILNNLLSNAIKFSKEGDEIMVNTSVLPDKIVVEVSDQGMGISKEDQQHLFERFFRGENASNITGTGLGLNIVSKYVELMNGYIEVSSVLEEGSTFTISFARLK